MQKINLLQGPQECCCEIYLQGVTITQEWFPAKRAATDRTATSCIVTLHDTQIDFCIAQRVSLLSRNECTSQRTKPWTNGRAEGAIYEGIMFAHISQRTTLDTAKMFWPEEEVREVLCLLEILQYKTKTFGGVYVLHQKLDHEVMQLHKINKYINKSEPTPSNRFSAILSNLY